MGEVGIWLGVLEMPAFRAGLLNHTNRYVCRLSDTGKLKHTHMHIKTNTHTHTHKHRLSHTLIDRCKPMVPSILACDILK